MWHGTNFAVSLISQRTWIFEALCRVKLDTSVVSKLSDSVRVAVCRCSMLSILCCFIVTYGNAIFLLFAADNSVTGSIPTEFAHLPSLKEMDIRNCSLVGLLPPELSTLHATLEFVLLSSNGISGPIPSSFGGLTNLQVLDRFLRHSDDVQ